MNESKLLQLAEDLGATMDALERVRRACGSMGEDVRGPLHMASLELERADDALTLELGEAVKRERLPLPRAEVAS